MAPQEGQEGPKTMSAHMYMAQDSGMGRDPNFEIGSLAGRTHYGMAGLIPGTQHLSRGHKGPRYAIATKAILTRDSRLGTRKDDKTVDCMKPAKEADVTTLHNAHALSTEWTNVQEAKD